MILSAPEEKRKENVPSKPGRSGGGIRQLAQPELTPCSWKLISVETLNNAGAPTSPTVNQSRRGNLLWVAFCPVSLILSRWRLR